MTPLRLRTAAKLRHVFSLGTERREFTDQIFCEQCVDLIWLIFPSRQSRHRARREHGAGLHGIVKKR
jgi:hypothetical protein